MPTPTKYTYSLASDFPGGAVWVDTLVAEISTAADITIGLQHIDVAGDVIDIWFKDVLPVADKTAFDADTAGPAGGLIAAHDNTVISPGTPVVVEHTAQQTNPDGVPYSIPKASGFGYVLQDRDILICMGKVTQATAVEDLKVATGTYNPADPYSAASVGDGSQVDWGEAILRGCYKRVTPADPNGAYVACVDQADADALASLTIIDFIAGGPGTTNTFEIKGGSLFPDMGSLGFTAGKEREHRIYAVMAPGTGADARFFDAYLEPYRLAKDWVPASSTDAMRVTATPPVDISSLVRVWIYSEPGFQGCHVLRMILYRT